MSTTKNPTTLDLEGDRALTIRRTFNAPPTVVFDAWTKPEFVRRWWAPSSHGVVMVVCDAQLIMGGPYRYEMKHGEEEPLAFYGSYLEINPGKRLVYTQFFEPMADAGAVVVTVTFTEREGKTDVVSHEVYPSADARTAALESGMEPGMRETMDQLDELVGTLAAETV